MKSSPVIVALDLESRADARALVAADKVPVIGIMERGGRVRPAVKRSIRGTYVSVEQYYLHRYLDEQALRFNERKMSAGREVRCRDGNVSGKRLT